MADYSATLATQPQVPYKAFSGANIYATVGAYPVGTLQAVTVSITREVAALYSFSDANPKTFVKGKRGIAGTLVFTQFDRHALLRDIFRAAYDQPLNQTPSLFSSRFLNINSQQGILSGESVSSRNFAHDIGAAATAQFLDIQGDITTELTRLYKQVGEQKLRYSDQIPEFDIVLTMVNESGDAAFVMIGGIVLVNEGWGYTLDDLVSESAFTYVARYITPLTSLRDDLFNESNKLNAAVRPGFSRGGLNAA